jgi:hypothetical protein
MPRRWVGCPGRLRFRRQGTASGSPGEDRLEFVDQSCLHLLALRRLDPLDRAAREEVPYVRSCRRATELLVEELSDTLVKDRGLPRATQVLAQPPSRVAASPDVENDALGIADDVNTFAGRR